MKGKDPFNIGLLSNVLANGSQMRELWLDENNLNDLELEGLSTPLTSTGCRLKSLQLASNQFT
jgi:hypothetical protein